MAWKEGDNMGNLPNDPVMLLSYVNTQLRDSYESLFEFCQSNDVSMEALTEKLAAIQYRYDQTTNQFI